MTLDHLPDNMATHELAIDLRLELVTSLLPLAELTWADDLCRDLESLAKALGDPARSARVYAVIMGNCRRACEYERAVDFAERARALADSVGDETIQASVTLNLGMAYFALGDYRAAQGCFQQTMGFAAADGAFRQAPLTYPLVARTWVAACLTERGEFAEGATLATEAVRAEATNLPWDLALTLQVEGGLYLQQGALGKAVGVLERGAALCESADIAYYSRLLMSTLGHAYALTGGAPEAVQMLERMEQAAGPARYRSRRIAPRRLPERGISAIRARGGSRGDRSTRSGTGATAKGARQRGVDAAAARRDCRERQLARGRAGRRLLSRGAEGR